MLYDVVRHVEKSECDEANVVGQERSVATI